MIPRRCQTANRHWVVLLATVALLCGCGRTGLLVTGQGVGGEGGTGGSAPSGGGGTGAAGGRPPTGTCPVVRPDGPVVRLGCGNLFNQRNPSLLVSNTDPELVTLLTTWTATASPSPDAPTELRHVSFKPWAPDATTAVSPCYLADLDRGASFASQPLPDGRFALLMANASSGIPSGGIVGKFGFKPDSGDLPSTTINVSNNATRVADWSAGLFALLEPRVAPERWTATLGFATVDSTIVGQPVACASTSMEDSIRLLPRGDQGWLGVMASAGLEGQTQTSACQPGSATPDPGPADQLWTLEISRDNNDLDVRIGNGPLVTPPISMVRIAPRDEGAWVLWTQQATEEQRWVSIAPLEGAPTTFGAPIFIEESKPGEILGPVGLTSQGSDALVATTAIGPDSARLVVRFANAAGQLSASEPLALDGRPTGELALLPSPDGQGALVAWTEQLAGEPDFVKMARFSCSE